MADLILSLVPSLGLAGLLTTIGLAAASQAPVPVPVRVELRTWR